MRNKKVVALGQGFGATNVAAVEITVTSSAARKLMVTASRIGRFVGCCVVYFQSLDLRPYGAIKNKEDRMSIATVTMHEFNEENMHVEVEALYETIVHRYFPKLEQVINIKTGPDFRDFNSAPSVFRKC